MSDEKQLKILRSGVEEWNRWRQENRGIKIDLAEANLVEANLLGADLQRANLQKAKLQQAELKKANLQEADLSGADLQATNLQETSLSGSVLQGANLQGANFTRANLWEADLREANLLRANLVEANLVDTKLQKANLQSAYLQEAKLQQADLQRAHLQRADLESAYLQQSKLQQANFAEANLRRANFQQANLWKANLQGADLYHTVFAAAHSLAQAQGLEGCNHKGPSTVDQATLKVAQGLLPKVFLKGCGFQDWEVLQAKLHDPNLRPDEVIDITYEVANLRTKGPIQVNSLFISYSREDAAFVDFIEKRLDDDGIRSWRDVHHMTAGPVEQQIERAIDLNGTVLLVLSENSLGSAWVEWEVARAEKRQRELQQQGKDTHVLCPVAIDRTWEQSRWPGPLMNQIKKYNILDFSSWETNDAEASYQKLKAGIAKYYTS